MRSQSVDCPVPHLGSEGFRRISHEAKLWTTGRFSDEKRALNKTPNPQIQLGGEWPHRLSSVGNPAQVVVRAHGEAEFSVPKPTESEPWRVPVAYVWAPSLYQRFTTWIAVHVLLRLRGGTRVEQLQAFTIFSPTVVR